MQEHSTRYGPPTDITHYHGQDEPEAHAVYPCGDDECPYYIDNVVRALNNHESLLAALARLTLPVNVHGESVTGSVTLVVSREDFDLARAAIAQAREVAS